jgi:hypothetical protein
MHPNFRKWRRAIYSLKRANAQAVTVYRKTNQAVNTDSGELSEDVTTYEIGKVVVLPTKLSRAFAYDLSFIANNRDFTFGGHFDVQIRQLLLDRRDLPTSFVLDLNDHLVFNHKRYEIVTIQDIEEGEILLVIAKHKIGSVAYEIQARNSRDRLAVTDTVTGRIEHPASSVLSLSDLVDYVIQ